MRRVLPLLLGVVGLGTVASACTTTPYAAVVDGSVISQASLTSTLSAIKHNSAYLATVKKSQRVTGDSSQAFATPFVAQVLTQQIQLMLVRHAVAARHLRVGASDVAQARADLAAAYGGAATFRAFPTAYQHQLTSSFADVTALEASLARVNLSTSHLRALYAASPSTYAQICTTELLVRSPAGASAATSALAKGQSFTAVVAAAKKSGQEVAEGVVGCGTAAQYTQALGSAIEQKVVATPTGRVAGPISTSHGEALFHVDARQSVSFAAAEATIRAQELSSAGATLQRFLTAQVRSARISVNPADGRLSISKGVRQVVAPAGPSSAALAGTAFGAGG